MEKTDFMFMDYQDRPFRVKTWGLSGHVWLFRLGPDRNWVSMRQVSEDEIDLFRKHEMPAEQAKEYRMEWEK